MYIQSRLAYSRNLQIFGKLAEVTIEDNTLTLKAGEESIKFTK